MSADPPTSHSGHAGIVRWAATALGLDELWLLPVFEHAYSDKKLQASFEDRLEMCRLGFDALEGVRIPVLVTDAERRVAEAFSGTGPVGTIDTVEFLAVENPQTRFVLIVGGDTYQDLKEGRWKRTQDLLASVDVVPVGRDGFDAQETTKIQGLGAVSSTRIREAASLSEVAEWLHPAVLAYIRDHRLYGF